MAITFSTTVSEVRPLVPTQKQFNDFVRTALMAAARFWIRNFLPLHFGTQASNRYKYHPRTPAWKAAKLGIDWLGRIGNFDRRYNAARRKGALKGMNIPRLDPKPYDFTGELKREVLGRGEAAMLQATRATATSTRQRVKIPIKIPHPINRINSGELGRLLNSESTLMHREATDALMAQIAGDFTSVAGLPSGMRPKPRRIVIQPAA